jgi:putative nucleotidyltransferase with HDIG domain
MQAVKDSTPLHIDKDLEIPSVPIVLSKILQLVDDNRASARVLEELILHDASLSVRVIKLANSALYSFRSEVKTVAHAIALLGLNMVKSLAIGVSVFESFTQGFRDEITFISRLWMHSFGVGLIAQEIWTKRSNRAEGEFALLCGLLHDVGKVIYFKKDVLGYSQLFAMENSGQDPDIRSLEVEYYGVDHAVLGAILAKQWNLPSELTTVVRHHHDPDAGELPLVAAVSMADVLAKQAGIGYDGDHKITADLAVLQRLLKIDGNEYNALLAFAVKKRTDVDEFFQLAS